MPILPKNFSKNTVIWNEIQSRQVVVRILKPVSSLPFFWEIVYLRAWLRCGYALKPCSRQHRIPEKKKKTSAHQNVIVLAIEK